MGQDMALTVHTSLILPHTNYCGVIDVCASKHLLFDLHKIQKISCKIIPMADNRSRVQEMHELELMKLDLREAYIAPSYVIKTCMTKEMPAPLDVSS